METKIPTHIKIKDFIVRNSLLTKIIIKNIVSPINKSVDNFNKKIIRYFIFFVV